MLFTLEDIQAHFRPQDMTNGLHYSIDKRVYDIQFDQEAQRVSAQVKGSGSYTYHVQVQILGSAHHRIIRSVCSCPVGHDCKHAAALMYSYLQLQQNARQVPDIDPVQDWLQALSQALAAPAEQSVSLPNTYPDKVHHRLLYVLTTDAQGRCLFVSLKSGRLLKDGRIGSVQPFGFDFFIQGQAAPQYVLAHDERILRQLFIVRGHDQRFRLQGQDGWPILQEMLKTQRCYWQHVEQSPLQLGSVIEGHFNWRANAQGKQQLVLTDAQQSELQLISHDPWLYLDQDENLCGQIKLDIEGALARALINCPPLAPEQVPAFNQKAHKVLDKLNVPTPHSMDVRKLDACKPVPGLLLESFHVEVAAFGFGHKQNVLVHTATLFYEYQGVRVFDHQSESTLRLHHFGELVEFTRDRSAEQQWKQSLPALQNVNDVYSTLIANRLKKHQYSLPTDTDWVVFMLEQAPALESRGWIIDTENDFQFNLLQPDDWYGELDQEVASNGWFTLELGVLINGQRVNLLPLIIQQYQANPAAFDLERLAKLDGDAPFLLQMGNERIMLPIRRIRPILTTLVELFDDVKLTEKLQLEIPESQVTRLLELAPESGEAINWKGGVPLRELAQKLRNFAQIASVEVPENFQAELRPYQRVGLNWLQFLREYQLAGILADDMGLGKTVQALAHIQIEKNAGRMSAPCLVIAPTSLMFNWREESAKFTPTLKVLSLHGQQRHQHFEQIAQMDVVLTTYPLLVRDIEQLILHRFHLLILDEAQIIKNPKAKASQLVRLIQANHRICLTGTPMENHLGELWSLFDFLMPGFLGTDKQFNRYYRQPIEKHSQFAKSQALSKRIAPFLLRRRKQEVAQELPPKTEIIRKIELEGTQRDLYETIRVAMNARIQQEIADKGIARSQIVILDALLKLRQVCCDPRLLKLDSAKQVNESAKLELLMELITELEEEGRRILVFSQFTSMLAIIEQRLKKQKIKYVLLTGETRDRESPIRLFQSGSVPVFLISLKAGGTGLNLTAADTVIHYDPWWNPAVENQATDRAYRIGQDKPVFVYKLVTENTVEEKIQAMQLRKQALAEGVYGRQTQDNEKGLTLSDLQVLFEPIDAAQVIP